MKVTPLEIRQKQFEKAFRGYDKDEVSAFLLTLSQAWEKVLDENKELKIKLENSEKEVEKLREVESSLFKTLKTAEDTGANMIDQANKAADLHLREAQMKSDTLLSEAKSKAKNLIENAEEETKRITEEMGNEVKELELNFRLIQNQKENLIYELHNVTEDIMEKVKRLSEKEFGQELKNTIKKAKELTRNVHETLGEEEINKPAQLSIVEEPDTSSEPEEKIPLPEKPEKKYQPKPRDREEINPNPTVQAKHKKEPQPVKGPFKNGASKDLSFFDELD